MLAASVEYRSNIERTRQAFSAQAPAFDSYDESNVILQWMRRQVYRHEEEFLSPGDSILELNAGTGIDAVYFAQKGHRVLAIDNADGMLHELRNKIRRLNLEGKIRAADRSFTELNGLPEEKFDHVFSNFGGLNCIADLHLVTDQLPRLLNPGATVTFVIMPRVCPWELLHLLTGNMKLALRRFSPSGTIATIEHFQFLTYYYSPRDVVRSFDSRFRLLRLRGLASLSPPPHMTAFALKHRSIYNSLTWFDEHCSHLPPFNRWADHTIITMKYSP